MPRNPLIPFRIVCMGIALTASVYAAAPADPRSRQIPQAIADLGHPSYDTRERATRLLWSLGKAAEPALIEAAKGDDPEAATRARRILADLRVGLRPDTPSDIAELLRAYYRGPGDRRQMVVQMLSRLQRRGHPYLARLWSAETDANIRNIILREIGRSPADAASAFIAEGNVEQAARLLESAAADRPESDRRALATFLFLRNAADRKIAELRPLAEQRQFDAAAMIFHLYRAKGDLPNARWAAQRIGDDDLLRQIHFETHDWKALTQSLRAGNVAADAESLGFQAAYSRLAGDEQNLQRTLDQLRRFADAPQHLGIVAEAMLLNDRPDEAIDLYVKHGQFTSAFELLCAQRQYRKALDMAEKNIRPSGTEATNVRCRMGRILKYLGESDQATATFNAIAAQIERKPDLNALRNLLETEAEAGLIEEAINHFALATAYEKDPQKLHPLIAAIFPQRDTDAIAWWTHFRPRHSDEDAVKILHRVHDILDRKLPRDQLKTIADDASNSAPKNRPDLLAAAAHLLLLINEQSLAQATLEKLIDASDNLDHALLLADLHARNKRWQPAADIYARAIEKDPANPVPRYLLGHALTQAGHAEEGKSHIDRALLMPLASDEQRLALVRGLRRAGLHQPAAEQSDLLIRTGSFDSWYVGEACRLLAYDVYQKGNYLQAADLWERSMLDCLRGSTAYLEQSTYITTPHLVHRVRAAGLLQQGKLPEAMKEIAICEKYIPGNSDSSIELFTQLKKLGHHKEAEDLFTRAAAAEEKLCADFPRSPQMHNSLAWLLARCRRDLDKALDHARKGVELDPTNTAILDTLAEVHFQRNERQPAIDLMKKCMELEPDNPRHQQALDRIERGSPDSAPPPA